MNRKIIFIILILGIILIGVGYMILQSNFLHTKIQYENIEFLNRDDVFGCGRHLSGGLLNLGDSFVVDSQEEYKKLQSDTIKSFNCEWNTLPPEIDFSKKTLLGNHASGGGCSIDFKKKVYQDDSNKKIIHSVKVVEKGRCDKLGSSMNWVIIQKVPSDYSVEFEVK
ncbi:MAG: hypothetical protein ABIA78_02055 [archaeon]